MRELRIFIRNAPILPMTGPDDFIPGGDVLIEGDTIAWVGPSGGEPYQLDSAGPEKTYDLVIDGRDRLVMPGLVNAHTHSPMVLFRGSALLRRAAKLAGELGIGARMHVSESTWEVRKSLAEHGATPVQRLERLGLLERDFLAVHCVHLSQSDIEILARRRAFVAHNPGSNLKVGNGVAPVPALVRAGVRVSLGTDGAASNNSLDVLHEVRLAGLIHNQSGGKASALSPYSILEMATANGAAGLGLGDGVGRIRPGFKADLILLRTDGPHWFPRGNPLPHLVYSARQADVETVIVNGRVLMYQGRLTTIDEREVRARAEECWRRLMA